LNRLERENKGMRKNTKCERIRLNLMLCGEKKSNTYLQNSH
jgi:hypothetical protein